MVDSMNNEKKIIIITLTLLVLIVGASYAYFSVSTTNNFGTRTISGSLDSLGSVSLVGTNSNIALNLSAAEMMQSESGSYWGTTTGIPSKNYNNIEIAHTSVNGPGTYNCTYELNVTQTNNGSKNMYTAYQNWKNNGYSSGGITSQSTDATEGQIVLSIGNQSYDFYESNLFPITVSGTLYNITADNIKTINASLRVSNKNAIKQNALAGSDINISITATSFNCKAIKDKDYTTYLRLSGTSQSALLYKQTITNSQIESVEFLDSLNLPEGEVAPYDVSSQGNNKILATYVKNNETNRYKLYVGQEGGVVANANSSYLFYNFTNLTSIDFNHFDTSIVTSMSNMFNSCSSLTRLDLSNFNTSSVTDMSNMFSRCSGLTNLDLSNFNTSSVTNMSNMFNSCSSLTSLDISNFNTSSVTTMYQLFYSCSSLTRLDVSSFNTSSVTSMASMFSGCSGLTNLDLSNFNTSSVTSMANLFSGCSGLTSLDISNFNTSNVTIMQTMFSRCSSLTSLDVSNFNTSSVTSMSGMFNSCSSLTNLDVSNFNTSSVTNMSNMFDSCSSLTSLDVSNFNTSIVTTMRSMFSGCSNLVTIYVSSNFDTDAVTDSKYMFNNCAKLKGGNGTTHTYYIDKTYARIDAPGTPGYFTGIA